MSYELTDEEWEKLKNVLPSEEGKQGRPCLNLRRTLSGIKWIGCSWRALPPQFGNWNSVYRYFGRLEQNGIFEEIKLGFNIRKSTQARLRGLKKGFKFRRQSTRR